MLESKGNRIGDNISETPKNAAGIEDTKPKGTYTGVANGVDALGETLTEGITTSLSAIKLKAYQQQIVGPAKSHCAKSDGDVQMDDAEMNDVKFNTVSHKLGVKKDLVSKSCPPKLRTTSPRSKGMLCESRERNQKTIQRATPLEYVSLRIQERTGTERQLEMNQALLNLPGGEVRVYLILKSLSLLNKCKI